jgi:hypothetical protein
MMGIVVLFVVCLGGLFLACVNESWIAMTIVGAATAFLGVLMVAAAKVHLQARLRK